MTDHQGMIKELHEQNDLLENYFSNTIIPQLFVDAQLVLRKFTPPAMKQFNLSLDDVGKSILDIHDNFRFPGLMENIQQVIDAKTILEKEIQTTDFRWYQMNIIPYLSGEKKTPNGVIITFVEITSRIRDLKEQESLIADHEILLDSLTHDIKNPLSALVLAVGQLNAMGIKDDVRFAPMVAVTERALQKIQRLINELGGNREVKHRYKSTPELLNLEHIMEDVRFALKDNLDAAGAVIHTDINVSEVYFTRRKMRSVLYNLINNAIKYKSPERSPVIMIKSISNEAHVEILVKDNGMGIPREKQADIFAKYFRVNTGGEGSGMGLYLVSEIVRSAGGTISVKSEPGIGTEFRISLKGS